MSLKDLINSTMPSLIRGGLSVGAWAMLMSWRRGAEGRQIQTTVMTVQGETKWILRIVDVDRCVYEGTDDTLEPLGLEALSKLGLR